jgi:hypothetical protein
MGGAAVPRGLVLGFDAGLALAAFALWAREAPAPLGRRALEAPATAGSELVVVEVRGRIGLEHGGVRLARGTFGNGTRGRAGVETQATAGLVLALALDRVAQVLYVIPPRAGLGLGHAYVAVLFRVLTGLADGLALKELALRAGRHDSPQLWVPRFPTPPTPSRGPKMGNSAVLTAAS